MSSKQAKLPAASLWASRDIESKKKEAQDRGSLQLQFKTSDFPRSDFFFLLKFYQNFSIFCEGETVQTAAMWSSCVYELSFSL